MSRSDPPRSFAACAAACAACLLLAGCVENGLEQYFTPFDYDELPPAAAPPPAEGAVWRGASPSGSFLFFDQKARGLGDLVTVVIQENIQAEGRATTGLGRVGTISNNLSSDVGFTDIVAQAIKRVIAIFVDDPGRNIDRSSGEEVNILESSNTSNFEGSGSTTRSGRLTGVITCRVVNVLPNNVFHIRGRRSLLVNHEEQFLTLEALVRQEDISINNTVSSIQLAEARLTMDGIGVIDDKQRPGWLARVLDWVYPF